MAEFVDDPRYRCGMEAFNRGEYFEAHEVWESLWLVAPGPEKPFYKGLIQLAVALHHAVRGNACGAERLLDGAGRYLRPYGPWHLGLAVEPLLAEASSYASWMLRRATEAGAAAAGSCPYVPQIRLDRPPPDVCQ